MYWNNAIILLVHTFLPLFRFSEILEKNNNNNNKFLMPPDTHHQTGNTQQQKE